MDIYFVQKEGIYFHGVYWIGFNGPEGIKAVHRAAREDNDSYHEWVLYRYVGMDKEPERLYSITKDQLEDTGELNDVT